MARTPRSRLHGCKTKCDRKDAKAIARLLKGGNFPPAYAYPRERRGLRDIEVGLLVPLEVHFDGATAQPPLRRLTPERGGTRFLPLFHTAPASNHQPHRHSAV
jgi:hypothetical protein